MLNGSFCWLGGWMGVVIGAIAPSAFAAQPSPSFQHWCEQAATLPAETRHTVELLRQIAGTEDCAEAEQILASNLG
ncbi:MAG: hypothetical protein HC929_12725 [Leptolyngbyaceae cyanobacterium SM2_5_2]|nr:hypothetical protein [Leptolyngbyaceae cyanobacterium SM2_5_2]